MGRCVNSTPPPLCRDCLALSPPESRRCRHCGSPRLLIHPERDQLTIAHVDCDAFYAAIEKRDNPALTDQPVIVGGGRRGVVSTACYLARTYGVRSAMPMFKALALCPQATIIRPDMAKYSAVGRTIRGMMLELTPQVEPLSIDEAFIDLSGTERLHGSSPALTLVRFAGRIEKEIGISVSIGLSYCKFLAKLASDLDKPRGFAVIGRADASDFLETCPVGVIWGVGVKLQQAMVGEGLRTIGDLRKVEEADLIRRFGLEGRRFHQLARGIDERRVSPNRSVKSLSSETTFERDMANGADLSRALLGLCEKLARRLKRQNLAAEAISLKLKSADFRLITRSRTLAKPTQLAGRLFEAAEALLLPLAVGTPYRLIGIGVSHLCDPDEADQVDLADSKLARDKAAEAAIDELRRKFGDEAIVRGRLFEPRMRD
jgi:DNA polymerase-4